LASQEVSADLTKNILQLDDKLREVGLTEKKRAKVAALVASTISFTLKSHTGPIPSPEALKQYEEIKPGTAERLIAMAEKQSDHRISLEKKVIVGQLLDQRVGQYLGFIVALCFLYASYSLGMSGHDALGGTLGGITLVSLVTIFVLGKKKQKDELEKKA
jgi:uncharacterized membrane protein